MRKGFNFSINTVVVLAIAVSVILIAAFMFNDTLGVSKAFGMNRTNMSYGNVIGGG